MINYFYLFIFFFIFLFFYFFFFIFIFIFFFSFLPFSFRKRFRWWDRSNQSPEVRVFRRKIGSYSYSAAIDVNDLLATDQLLCYDFGPQLFVLDLITGQSLATFPLNENGKQVCLISHPPEKDFPKNSTVCVMNEKSPLLLWSYTTRLSQETSFVAFRWFFRRNLLMGVLQDHILLISVGANFSTKHCRVYFPEQVSAIDISCLSANQDNIFIATKLGAFYTIGNPGCSNLIESEKIRNPVIKARLTSQNFDCAATPIYRIEDGSEFVAFLLQGQGFHFFFFFF
jgi:hypothetical protein